MIDVKYSLYESSVIGQFSWKDYRTKGVANELSFLIVLSFHTFRPRKSLRNRGKFAQLQFLKVRGSIWKEGEICSMQNFSAIIDLSVLSRLFITVERASLLSHGQTTVHEETKKIKSGLKWYTVEQQKDKEFTAAVDVGETYRYRGLNRKNENEQNKTLLSSKQFKRIWGSLWNI